jgi:hypothetical protein
MDESAAFENFYTEKIEPSLPRLRAECKQADIWHLVAVLCGILGIGTFFCYYAALLTGEQASWLCVLFAVTGVFAFFKYANRNDRFTDDFKIAVIKTIIDEVCPGLVYKPGETISPHDYKTSSLYRYRYDYFDGDDWIEGLINNIPFHCAELHIQSDYAGNKQITVFKGLFFVAKINSRFAGGTYVWPRNRAQLPTSMMDEEYRLLPMPHVQDIHFNDAEFDHYFRVCSTWPSQAHEILTAEMRSNLLRISKAMKIAASFSFAAGKCFIGIPIAADLLEPTDYDPGDKEELRKYFISIRLITNIVKGSGLSALQ